MAEVITAFMPAAMDACALYRMFIPHLNVEGSRFIFSPGVMPLELFVESRVAVVQRQVTANNFAALVKMKEFGLKLVYDLDDNLWAIPAYNTSAKRFKAMQEGFGYCASMCDIITVTTRGLKTAVNTALRHLGKEVVVIPNYMDFNLFKQPLVTKDDNKVIIGWAGSGTHDGDFGAAWEVLPEVIQENENVHLEIIGKGAVPKGLIGHERVLVRNWVQVGEYPVRFSTWAWDIILAPLEDNRFNRSKSAIKLLEAGAINAACLVSAVQPYEDFCALGGDDYVKATVCRTKVDWKSKLTALIQDVEHRQFIASRTRSIAMDFYNIETGKEQWQKVFKELCPN